VLTFLLSQLPLSNLHQWQQSHLYQPARRFSRQSRLHPRFPFPHAPSRLETGESQQASRVLPSSERGRGRARRGVRVGAEPEGSVEMRRLRDQVQAGAFFFLSFSSLTTLTALTYNRRRSSTHTRMTRRISNSPSSSSAVNASPSDSARETGKSSFPPSHLPILIRLLDCHSKNCKRAVLSDAPFVKHDNNLWHLECFVCSYCVVRSLPHFLLLRRSPPLP
jgi:hypothetical protein